MISNKINYLLISMFFLFQMMNLNAQNVQLQQDNFKIDGQTVMKFERRAVATEISLYNLVSEEEEIFIVTLEAPDYGQEDRRYHRIYFPLLNKTMETTRMNFFAQTLKWLVRNGVIEEDGKVNEQKLDIFIAKYDENISGR